MALVEPPPPPLQPPDPSLPQAPPQALCRRSGAGASIEDQVRFSFYTPSPVQYNPKQPARYCEVPLGKISEALVPSALEAPLRATGFVPGPGAYETCNTDCLDLPEGGRLNVNPPYEGVLPKDVYATPPPNAYDPKDPSRPAILYGPFNKDAKAPLHIREAEKLSKEMPPGPGEYDFVQAAEHQDPFCPAGGRTLMASKPASYFDAAARLTGGQPGPDNYNVAGSIEMKNVGQAVWRHESTTFQETKTLVNKFLNLSGVTPGPGAYDLPEASKPTVPTLKSKKVSHGMPKPFNYNCTEDLSRKFVPFRQRNSTSMIYDGRQAGGGGGGGAGVGGDKGEGLARPASRGSGRTKKEPESQLRETTGLTAEPDPEPLQRGLARPASDPGLGLAGVRRAQSAGSIGVDYHPAVEQAAKYYPKLAGKHRRATGAFMPMASRRCERVSTDDDSLAYQRYHLQKRRLDYLAENLHDMARSALEPLDADKLLKESVKVLEHKARTQLRNEGVSRDKADLVMAEMPALFERPESRRSNKIQCGL